MPPSETRQRSLFCPSHGLVCVSMYHRMLLSTHILVSSCKFRHNMNRLHDTLDSKAPPSSPPWNISHPSRPSSSVLWLEGLEMWTDAILIPDTVSNRHIRGSWSIIILAPVIETYLYSVHLQLAVWVVDLRDWYLRWYCQFCSFNCCLPGYLVEGQASALWEYARTENRHLSYSTIWYAFSTSVSH